MNSFRLGIDIWVKLPHSPRLKDGFMDLCTEGLYPTGFDSRLYRVLEKMNSNLSAFLKQPYPFYYKGKQLFYFAISIFMMSLFFNYLFEPFNKYTPEHKMDFFWISVIHSVNAALVVFLFFGPVSIKVNEDKWTVKKEMILATFLFVSIGIFQFLIRDLIYDNPYNWSWRYLIEEIRNTCLVGVLFFSILVPVNYIRLKSQHTDIASQFNTNPHPEKIANKVQTVAIQTRQKSDDFSLDPNGFLFAKAEGNYLEILVSQNGQVQKLLKRMTLKEFEAQLNAPDHIIRTHRSYLVNLHHVSDIKGNAQGYQLHLTYHPETIPVSRGMIPLFESRINT